MSVSYEKSERAAAADKRPRPSAAAKYQGSLLDVVVFDDLVDLFLTYLFHAKHGQSMSDNILILSGILLCK
jgi:hypothetical protein